MNAITINSLYKTYKSGTKAVINLDLIVKEGDFFALLGSNGAGKTTTIGIMTALVNKTSGSVKIFDIDIDKEFDKAKTYIGVVPQEFNFSIFEKVINIVVQQGGYYGIPESIAKPRAVEILTRLGLGDKLDTVARGLSGGMKRRLMIARALIHEPRLLILDEPTAGVDVELRVGMWEYLKFLNEEKGVTILLTTHYLEEVEQLCKNAAIIKDGTIVKQGSVRELLNSVEVETYLIEVDDTSRFNSNTDTLKSLDRNTFEVQISKGNGLNKVLLELDSQNIKVLGVRPRGNRLEELFLSVVKG